MKFQLEINYGGGTKAFLYSESDSNHEIEGAKVATNWLKTRMTSLKPPRKIIAREFAADNSPLKIEFGQYQSEPQIFELTMKRIK